MRDPPAHGVGMGQPTKELGQFAIALGPNHEVPVVIHDAVAVDAQRQPLVGFQQQAAEVREVLVVAEQFDSAGRAVEHMIPPSRRERCEVVLASCERMAECREKGN